MRLVRLIPVAVLPAALAVLTVAALATGSPSRPQAAIPARAIRPQIVGRVLSVQGRNLYVKVGNRLIRLRRGARLTIHALVVLGPATKTTIHLTIPRGVGDTSELLDIARFHTRLPPAARRMQKQIGIVAAIVHSHHTLRIEPRLVQLSR